MFSSIWPSHFMSFRSACSVSLCFLAVHASAFDVPYCSTLNTADTPRNASIYQSNGLCFDFCKADYAFAVVQGQGCWCSDYVPATTTTGCDMICPGYDIESCGGVGLYGYIQLMASPSGTRGAVSTSSTVQVSTVTKTTEPVTTTVIAPPSSTSTSEASSSPTTTSRSTSTTETTDSTTSTTWAPTPVISLQTITGKVQTVTVTPTIPPDSQNLNDLPRNDKGSGGLGTGGAVGLTIGLVALAAIIGAIIFFCLKKRRKQKEAEAEENSRPESLTGLGGQVPSRSMSEHSRYVLGTDGRQVVETWEPDSREPPPQNVRNSRLMPVDPRLDPFAPVYQRGENKSRESVNTLRDDHDYSRRVHGHGPILRATNPDE